MPNENENLNSNDQQTRGIRDDPGDPSGIVRHSTCFMRSPEGEVQEVEATPEQLVPRMVRGWRQCDPREEVTPDVRNTDAGNPDLLR